MAINNDRNLLEQQILSNSGLKGKELENLKARLAALSEQQLQAELSKSLSGNNKGEWYTGVMLEHNESVIMRNNHEQTTYTDDSGNEISELKDGDEVLERIIKITDDKGNVFETTVTFSGGKPLTQTKTKNGNTTETTTYKYNDDADVPFVTVETKKADQSKVMTNVLEIDENGNFDNEDFIDRKTTLLDGTEIFVVKENGRLTENVKKVGKPEVTTVYNGDNVQDLDSKKLNRLKQNDVYYDGKGNTYVQINAGETAQIMADRINKKRAVGSQIVTAQQIIELNPNLVKKNGEFVLQKFENGVKGLGEVRIPGEFDANSPFIKTRQSVQKANNLAIRAEVDRQVAKKVTESTNKKFAAELANNGFKPTRENAVFYSRFNALNPTQQQNVLSVIKYCRSQKITDPNKIKARILETFPEINLFDSGKTIPQTNNNVPLYQRKNPVALETFLTETLKLDLKSETGAMVYEKLASLPQEHLNKINAQNFSDLSKANFVEIAHRLEANGIDIRSRQEHQIENNSPRMKAEQEKRELRESASKNIALAYDNAINIIKQYQGNQGWINVGFYREKLGKLLSNVNPTKINTCFDDVIKELEKEKKFAVGYLKGKSTNDKEFKEAFKKISGGVEYNEANMKAFLDVAQDQSANFEDEKYNEKFWNAYNKAFGVAKTDKNGKVYYEPQVVKQATSRTNFQQYVDGAGDIVLMLLGTEAIGKGVAWTGGKLISKVSPYVPKFLANAGSKTVMTIGTNNITVGRVAANMASQSTAFTLWDASKNYINLKTKDIQYSGEAAEKEWEAYKEGNVESAKFGAFAGALNTTVVGKVINGTMKIFEKPIANAVSKVGKSFEKTSAMSGSDVMKTFMLNQTPGALAKTAGTIAEIGGFTLYETANEVIEELLKKGEDGHLPAKLTEDGLTSYLLDKLGDQAKNLGEIKAISRLIFMHKGAIQEQARLMDENLAKCETLKNVKIKKTEVNGREIFEVTMPDGSRKVANSVEEVIANCNVLMQLDMISNAAKENAKEEVEWRKMSIGGEEVEVAVVKNANGVENIDFSKCRKLNVNGQYEEFVLTTERDLLNSESDAVAQYAETSPIHESVPAQTNPKKLQETLDIFNQKEGLKDIKDEVKNQIATLVANTPAEAQDSIIKSISMLKNVKLRYGVDTPDYTDEQIFQIIKFASNPDGSLNSIAMERLANRMKTGPGDDNFQMDKVLPKQVNELNLARDKEGFFDNQLVEIGKKLTYAHQTREEIFKLLKDENGNPVKDLVELVLTDKSESFDEGDMILNVLKSLYTDGKLDINKVNQIKELVKEGSVSIYRAAQTMQSGMPADIMKNIGIFSQKGLTNNEINSVITYLKSKNIDPTFESVKDTIENCGNIPELREIHVKQLLNQRGESIDKSYYEYVKKMAQDIEQTIKTHPEMAELGLYPKDIIGNYIKLLHIEGRSTQLKQHEILELLDVRNRGPFSINSDKLIESGLLKDIPNREKPLDKRKISQLLKEDTETLKQIVDKNLLSDSFKALRNLKYGSSGVIISGGKSTLKMLSELPIEELNNYRMALDLDAAIKLVKTNPQKAQEIVKSMREFGYKDAEIVLDFIKDHNVELAEVLLNDNRFTKNTILKILPKSSSEIAQARLDFYNDYKNDGILRENGALIYLMNNVIPENRVLLDKIHSQGLFNNQDALLVAHWFNCTNKYNTRLVEKLYADNSYNFKSISEYSDIFSSIRNEQSAILLEKIYNNKEFSSLIDKNVLSNILYNVNETNIKFAEMLCFDKELYTDNKIDNKKMTIISDIFGNTNNGNIRLAERLYTDKELNFPKDKIPKILSNTHIDNVDFVEKICTNEELNLTMDDILHIINSEYSPSSSKYLAEKNIKQILDSVEMQRYKVLESPDLYVNGEYNNETEIKNAVEKFFNNNKTGLMVVSSLYDKEAFNNLLRMRFDDVKEYLEEINKFSKEELELVENLSKSCNVNGKPFMPSQKIEFMDLIKAYKDNKLSLEKMHSMIESGKVDIGQLNIDLFNTIMKNSGLTEEEIASIQKEKLIAWDTKYAHLLSKEINSEKDVAFSDLLRAGNLEPDFTQYIHNTNNIYGQTNVKTRNLYGELGMNYDKWLKPSKENEVHFVSKDRNTEQLSQIANLITEDINTLMQTPVKGFLRKQFPKFIKGDDFVIPNEYLTSKVKLTELVNLLADTSDKGQLAQVWKRAQGNSTNPDPNRATTARNTLTILDHLNQRLDDISKVQDTKASKTLDLTIKMWDRNPQKDIFQGNYSTCCIGMGGGNGSAMPHFVMDTAYNMIELVDNKTGKTIGNALCYFIKGANGKPAFIIDNIEINNGVKPSEEVGLQLRNSMVEYAARVSKEVTGLDDVSIYMSGSYNDVPCKDLKQEEQSISFLGDIDCEDIYMDLYGGWIEKENLNTKLHLLKLK